MLFISVKWKIEAIIWNYPHLPPLGTLNDNLNFLSRRCNSYKRSFSSWEVFIFPLLSSIASGLNTESEGNGQWWFSSWTGSCLSKSNTFSLSIKICPFHSPCIRETILLPSSFLVQSSLRVDKLLHKTRAHFINVSTQKVRRLGFKAENTLLWITSIIS